MQIQLEMGPGFDQTVRELSGMGRALVEACSAGLEKGVKYAAGRVVADYLSGQALKRRTGDLARAVDGWLASPLEGIVGVRPNSPVAKYAWILGDESIPPIVPKEGKYLTIPIGENITSTGATKYSSPWQKPEGFFVRTKKGKLLFGYKRGKRGKFRALFVLVKSVFVQPSGALVDGVTDSIDDISKSMEEQIGKKIGSP